MSKSFLTIERMTIGELSRSSGVNIETIRYYERIGLLPSSLRSPGGHRLFGPGGVRALTFIKRSRELGFGTEDIRAMLGLRGSETCCDDVKAIATRHLANVREKLQHLVEMESMLSDVVGSCVGGQAECRIIDMLEAPALSADQPTAGRKFNL